jgi:hypothetical protein
VFLARESDAGNNIGQESILTEHNDGFRVVKVRQWGTKKYELNRHLGTPFGLEKQRW